MARALLPDTLIMAPSFMTLMSSVNVWLALFGGTS